MKCKSFEYFVEDHDAGKITLTPWFRMISQEILPNWWQNMDDIEKFYDHNTIKIFSSSKHSKLQRQQNVD